MPWVPDEFFEPMKALADTVADMAQAAKDNPSPTGLVLVGLLFDNEGRLVATKKEGMRAYIPPGHVTLENGSVVMVHPDQHLSPHKVAALADVHVSTVRRAVVAGDLAKPVELSPRRVVHKLEDVVKWFEGRK